MPSAERIKRATFLIYVVRRHELITVRVSKDVRRTSPASDNEGTMSLARKGLQRASEGQSQDVIIRWLSGMGHDFLHIVLWNVIG